MNFQQLRIVRETVRQDFNLTLESTTRLAVRRGTYLRSYALAFIEKVCPDQGESAIKQAIQKQNGVDA